jgi:hypothetical protein
MNQPIEDEPPDHGPTPNPIQLSKNNVFKLPRSGFVQLSDYTEKILYSTGYGRFLQNSPGMSENLTISNIREVLAPLPITRPENLAP